MITSKDHIKAALNFQSTDKVPIDFGGHRSSGISAIAYARLKKALGINSGDIFVYDMIQQLAIVEPEVIEIFNVDTIELGRAFLTENKNWKDWVLPDGTACKIPNFINIEKRNKDWYLLNDEGIELGVQREGCLYFEQIHWPLINKPIEKENFSGLAEAFCNSMWTAIPSPGAHIALTQEGLKDLEKGAKQLRAKSDKAIIGLFGGNMFEIPHFLYRIDNYLLYMAMYPDACDLLAEKLYEHHLGNLEKWLKAVGPYLDIILFGDDLGGQNGPLISTEMYHRYCEPYHKKMWSKVKELSPHLKIQLHSCGGIEPLLEDLLDAGMDAVNPVQITCNNMNAAYLKEKYGKRLTLWGGGCDTRSILPNGKPGEVKKHVNEQLSILTKNGGFVFQQVHNIMADVPPENIIAMFKAVNEFQFNIPE